MINIFSNILLNIVTNIEEKLQTKVYFYISMDENLFYI